MTRKGWLLFGSMCVLWGLPYLLIKVAVVDLTPPVLVFCRTGVAAAVLLPVAAAKGMLGPVVGCWRAVLAFTILEIAGPWLLLADAERHLTSSLTGLLVAAVPLVAAVAGRVMGEEDRLDGVRAVGLLLGLCGVAALLGLDVGGQVRAGVEVGLVVLGYGTAPLVVSRRLSDVPSLGVIAVSLGITAVGYSVPATLSWPRKAPGAEALVSVGVLAVFCTIAAFLVFFALIAEAGPQRALVITFVNPAVALVLGVVLLGEHLTVGALVGFPLILIGCVLATRVSTRHPTPPVAAVALSPSAPA